MIVDAPRKSLKRPVDAIAAAAFETLETRQMLTSVGLSSGTLSITGNTNSTNTVHVYPKSGKINAIVDGAHTTYNAKSVKRIVIVGGNKSDTIEIDATLAIPAIVNAAKGNDVIIGGAGNDLLQGGGGNDTITGNGGNDAINGGIGDDALHGGAGNDSINGAAGNDVMYGDAGNDFFAQVQHDDKVVGGKGDSMTASKDNVPAKASSSTPSVGSGTGDTTTAVAATPVAVIRAISTSVPAGTTVHVDALASQLKNGEWNTGDYLWNFGDTGAEENSMKGFNAAHTYDTAGNYTVTLTVINAAGKQNTTTMTVNITAANRNIIYVAANGSDSNNGLSPTAPIQSIAKAESLLANNTEILFRRGDTFDMTAGFNIHQTNLVIGAYGTGDQPQILWTADRNSENMFCTYGDAKNVTYQDITINTIYDQDINDDGIPIAMQVGGTNITARRITYLNVMYGMNMNSNPTGVLMQDDTAPLTTGMRKYFAWVQGSHITIDGCYCANSTREHIVRANYVSMLNVSDNDFHNILVDSSEVTKTALNVQSGEFAYLYNNKLYSDFQVGPLGKTAGLGLKDLRFNYAIGEGNQVYDAEVVVNHGAQHITLRDNVIHQDNINSGNNIAINVDGYDDQYQRGVVDLTIQNNTAVNPNTMGTFLEVWGPVAGGLTVLNNLYDAPNLTIGSNGTAAVKIASTAFSSFTDIDGNVWPEAKIISSWLKSGDVMNYVGDDYIANDFQTLAEWNSLKPVGTDTYANLSPTDSYSVLVHGVRVGAKLAA